MRPLLRRAPLAHRHTEQNESARLQVCQPYRRTGLDSCSGHSRSSTRHTLALRARATARPPEIGLKTLRSVSRAGARACVARRAPVAASSALDAEGLGVFVAH